MSKGYQTMEVPKGGEDEESTPLVGQVPPSPPRNNIGKFPELKALVGEFMGTCVYVQIGCGMNCIGLLFDSSVSWFWKGIGWSLSLLLGIYISAAQSGGHLNPAVSLSFALVRRQDFSLQSVLPYWIAQLLGAFTAGVLNLFLFTTVISNFEEDELAKLSKKNPDYSADKDMVYLESASAFGNYYRYVHGKNLTWSSPYVQI